MIILMRKTEVWGAFSTCLPQFSLEFLVEAKPNRVKERKDESFLVKKYI